MVGTNEAQFIPVLREKFGIDAREVTIMKRSESCMTRKGTKKIPYLSIMATQASYEKIICKNRPQGLVNEEWFKIWSGRF